jgi:hypothetical protein
VPEEGISHFTDWSYMVANRQIRQSVLEKKASRAVASVIPTVPASLAGTGHCQLFCFTIGVLPGNEDGITNLP